MVVNDNFKISYVTANLAHVEETSGLLIIEARISEDPLKWMQENREFVELKILQHGGVLLRNFTISSLSEFNRFAETLYPSLQEYIYRSTPRTKLGGKIYTTTEYPADRVIPLHNENSYSRSWPNKILFYSVLTASEGGETPIADSRKVYQKIDENVKRRFEKNGVLYIRNYTPGIDLGWEEVFQTDKKEVVEQFCNKYGLAFEWRDKQPELTTRQLCQASVVHPQTGEIVWFNQAHLFHKSSLDKATLDVLSNVLDENNLPRNVFYGDGQEIEVGILEHIREIYQEEMIKFSWKKNDILILDNLLMAHGRSSYKGERKVVAAMA